MPASSSHSPAKTWEIPPSVDLQVPERPSAVPWTELSMLAGTKYGIGSKLWVMLVLFSVSLFAAWFPTLTKRTKYIRVPRIVFFIGKHFGTGVILSTAFVHLLQDAFENLGHPAVKERWNVGHWTGLLVLCSLLAIFLVEYISTSFVDRLHSYSSPEPSPPSSTSTSRTPSPGRPSSPHSNPQHAHNGDESEAEYLDTENDPLIRSTTTDASGYGSVINNSQYGNSHTNPVAHHYDHHSHRSVKIVSPHLSPVKDIAEEEALANASGVDSANVTVGTPAREDADDFFAGGHHRHELRSQHSTHSVRGPGRRQSLYEVSEDEEGKNVVGSVRPGSQRRRGSSRLQQQQQQQQKPTPHTKDGSKRSSTSHENGHGHGHTHSQHHDHAHVHLTMEEWDPDANNEDLEVGGSMGAEEETMETAEVKIGQRRQIVGILMLQTGIMIHSLVIGLTLAITTGSEFTSLLTAIIFHQLFEGLSLGIRIASLPVAPFDANFVRKLFKPILAFTFAVTTPLGIAIGLALFSQGRTNGAYLRLVQGLMSALSAGMLIYAACVEMLAGDFVMDPLLWRSSVRRQVLALGSVFAGVACMGLIG
ncbi:Zinc/iron permease [Panus rudis PR-1116 ss-1]|nr:Zinc/iron permease [Panus rudis PR-1116 ss-1]